MYKKYIHEEWLNALLQAFIFKNLWTDGEMIENVGRMHVWHFFTGEERGPAHLSNVNIVFFHPLRLISSGGIWLQNSQGIKKEKVKIKLVAMQETISDSDIMLELKSFKGSLKSRSRHD